MKRFLAALAGALLFSAAAYAASPTPANTFMYTPANPTGPASTTYTMMGIGVSGGFVPHYDGAAIVMITGNSSNNTAADGANYQLIYGTGAAPSNAGTFTGAACGNPATPTNSSLASSVSTGIPFTVQCIVTGLTLNQGYWFDLAAKQITGGTVTLTGITVSAVEE